MSPTTKKFIHGVAALFESEIEAEQRKFDEIEAARRDRERREQIFRRAAALRDAVVNARREASELAGDVDRLLTFPVERIYESFLRRMINVEAAAERLGQIEIITRHKAAILKFADETIIAPAEKALANFEKENATGLAALGDLQPADELQPNPAKSNYGDNFPVTFLLPTDGVRKSFGLLPENKS
jgi:hypothetical protein